MFERRQTVLECYAKMRPSSQLNNQVDYMFAVAAENDLGVGEFNDASSPTRLGEHTCIHTWISGSLTNESDYMAVASDRAGQVLARALFRGLNVHMRTLKTREVVRIRTS